MKAPPLAIRGFSLFPICGSAGVLAACAFAFRLAHDRGLPWTFVLTLAATAVGVQLLFTVAAALLFGERQRLIFYHRAAAFLMAIALVVWIAGRPLRPWLDLVTPSLFVFLAMGRFGCWSAGCCYGRPSRFGAAYSDTHSGAIPRPLIGLPLLPVQLAESVVACAAAWMGAAGASFETCFAVYATARFLLEYLRGEPGRRRALGLSEAQWTSAAIVAFVWPAVLIFLAAVAGLYRPTPAEHIVQLAQAISSIRIERAVATTSFGVTLTRESGELRVLTHATPRQARQLATLERLSCVTRSK